MPTIMPVYGTRPEAIKMAPVVRALADDPVLDLDVVVTAQHRAMLDQVNELFGIVPDADLDVMTDRQSLVGLSARILDGLATVLAERRPHAVLVQGDTTTSTLAALAAFYERIPVFHLEAGLRSGDLAAPFPEEGNRRLTAQLAVLHFAPTPLARDNLVREGVPAEHVVVTGNTVIDALVHAVAADPLPFEDGRVSAAVESGDPLVLVTAHRRESWEHGIAATARALVRVLAAHPRVRVVLPQHRNPIVRGALGDDLRAHPRVVLTEPLDYRRFTRLLDACTLVLTDSGGVQEEAPSLGKPVLVTRDTTERPEAVAAGTARLVGTDEDRIVAEVSRLLDDPHAYAAMSRAVNPYGDGHASERVVAAVRAFFGLGERIADFSA